MMMMTMTIMLMLMFVMSDDENHLTLHYKTTIINSLTRFFFFDLSPNQLYYQVGIGIGIGIGISLSL